MRSGGKQDAEDVALQFVFWESIMLAVTLERPCTDDPCAV